MDLLRWQDDFFKQLAGKGRSLNTLKNYKTDLECFNQYLLKGQNSLDINHFELEHIQQYGHFLEQKYNSDNSRRRRVQTLRIFFDYLVENNIFSTNPVKKIPTSPKFLDIPRPSPLIDIKTLWHYLLNESANHENLPSLLPQRNLIIFLLIYSSGLKVSDLSSLSVDDIHFPDDDLAPARVLLKPQKRDPYTVPLAPIFRTIFKKYSLELSKEKKKSNLEFEEILFNANPYRILKGGLSSRGIEVIFEELRNKLLIQITPKSLRQACIFKWLHEGRKEGRIKEWLGVAPAYSLKPYKEHLAKHIYDQDFLLNIYQNYKNLPPIGPNQIKNNEN
jgi:integrase/recombinase XerC